VVVVPILLLLSSFYYLPSAYPSPFEVDATASVYRVVDGDTFDAFPVGRVRLADVDAPEIGEAGYTEATNALKSLVLNKKVYLDVDDLNVMDRYNRIVCVVYVRNNSTHLMNVNYWLVTNGYAKISDYSNEFNPYTWTLYVYYPVEWEATATITVTKTLTTTVTQTVTATLTISTTVIQPTTVTATVIQPTTLTTTKTVTETRTTTITATVTQPVTTKTETVTQTVTHPITTTITQTRTATVTTTQPITTTVTQTVTTTLTPPPATTTVTYTTTQPPATITKTTTTTLTQTITQPPTTRTTTATLTQTVTITVTAIIPATQQVTEITKTITVTAKEATSTPQAIRLESGESKVIIRREARIPIRLSEAPNGLSGFELTVSVNPSVALIKRVEFPGFGLNESSGAPGSNVSIKAVDINNVVKPGDTNPELAVLVIEGISTGEAALNIEVKELDDDHGNPIFAEVKPGRVVVLVSPPPLPAQREPRDLDGDGLFEDLNGNGRLDFADVVLFFKHKGFIEANWGASLTDFNGNGRLDFDDIVRLFRRV